MLRNEIRGSAFTGFGTKRGRLLRQLPFSSPKSGLILSATQAPQRFHAENCVCLVLRCCAFIAHRAPSQKGIARTRGRKNWQLAVAYNGLSALGYGLLFAGCPEHLLFSRRARCRKSNKCHTIRIPVTNNVGKHSVESTFHGRRSSYIFSKKQLTNPETCCII